ncbi:MAG: hypothetical protein LVR00_03560 [Rhabdochlamydiaceae bacterium]
MIRFPLCVLVLLAICACSPSSLEDFRYEGESICKELAEELKGIGTHEQLVKEVPKIKSYFDRLVSVMIQARKFQKEHEEDKPLIDSIANSALLYELKRIYEIDGVETLLRKRKKKL